MLCRSVSALACFGFFILWVEADVIVRVLTGEQENHLEANILPVHIATLA